MNELLQPAEGAICLKCTGVGDAHKLTCPTLQLPQPSQKTGASR